MEKIVFYGTRGSGSLTARKYMEFGGATTCLMLNFGKTHILVDCGSGINNAIDDLSAIDELYLFISHSHIDHIGGIARLFSAFEGKKLHVYGKTYNGISIKDSVGRIMSQSLWPVHLDSYDNVDFTEITEQIDVEGVKITAMDSNHPGGCTLFRFEKDGEAVVTAFDFCHLDGFDKKLIEFAKGADTLIYDGCMSPEEFEKKAHWGHSTPEVGAEIGKAIGACRVYITHFGPYDDDALLLWEEKLQKEYPAVVFARSGQRTDELRKMVDVGALLSSEKDTDALLTKIVEACMDITDADGGTLYLLEGEELSFKVLINKTKNTKLVRRDTPIGLPSVNIHGKNACAAAAREKKLINVADCYTETDYDFSGTKEYDRLNGYLTKSVIVLPLIDEFDDVIGVLQLINAKEQGEIVPFRTQDEEVLRAIANQAGMSIVKSSYSLKINDLLYGFVKVMSVGIDERTPYNANHTRNMVHFADKFFDFEETAEGPYRVDSMKRREILMSLWLHDIGKILTPMEIMNKDSRLGDGDVEIKHRFERRDLLLQLSFAKGEITEDEYRALEDARKAQYDAVFMINKAGFLTPEYKEIVDSLAKETYREIDGTVLPILTKDEIYQLSIVKGTLNREERAVMESHVEMTQKFLSQLNFPKYYDNIPAYAGNHHEFLNGQGYPNHLTEKDLPWPCRLITVCDIYEALTAKDRPYKKPMPPERAFAILFEMADEGKLDRNVISEFEKSRCWEE